MLLVSYINNIIELIRLFSIRLLLINVMFFLQKNGMGIGIVIRVGIGVVIGMLVTLFNTCLFTS